MKAKFCRISAVASRAHLAAALALPVALFAAGSASADPATPEQKRAITACLRRQKASLSEACRAVFEH